MGQIAPAAERLGPHARHDHEAYERQLEFASVELSLQNLVTFPWVKARVEAGQLELHGAYFGVAAGRMLVRDPATGHFEPASARKTAVFPATASGSKSRLSKTANKPSWAKRQSKILNGKPSKLILRHGREKQYKSNSSAIPARRIMWKRIGHVGRICASKAKTKFGRDS
jgi:hypothetical protein